MIFLLDVSLYLLSFVDGSHFDGVGCEMQPQRNFNLRIFHWLRMLNTLKYLLESGMELYAIHSSA